jgi:hypothetical protein
MFLMNSDVDVKQCWQSMLMVIKSIIETLDDATLILTRRGLSIMSACFFHISLLHQNNYTPAPDSSSSSSASSLLNLNNLGYELCECMQLLVQLCDAVKYHLDKRTDGIRQIIQSWKEKNELCKRALMLVNFYNVAEVRNKALDLVRMTLLVSPNETMQHVVQIIYASYFASSSQIYLTYSSVACNLNTSANVKNQQQPCPSSVQLVSQAVHLMGPYFPLSKKLTFSQISSNLNKQPKLVLNMFMPIMFVAHAHAHGAIMLQQAQSGGHNEYEKVLIENYVPYLTFFDWLCRNAFNRRLIGPSAATSSSNSDASSPFSMQTTKQLIDLILFTSQQFILINISFISYLLNYLTSSFEQQQQEAGTTSSSNPASSSVSQSFLNNSEFYNLLIASPHLHTYISSILTDYRYLVSKKEIYEFFQIVLPRFLLNLVGNDSSPSIAENSSASTSSNLEKSSSQSSSNLNKTTPAASSSAAPAILFSIKTFIERCCHSLNEIRFYFEFQQLSKHLISSLKQTASNSEDQATTSAQSSSSEPLIPNITNHVDFKSSQMLGSIKTMYLILTSITASAELSALLSTNEDYNFFKFKVEIRNFLIEIMDYLRLQLVEMNNFIISLTAPPQAEDQAKETKSDSAKTEANTETEKANIEDRKEDTGSQDKETAESKTVEVENAKSASSNPVLNHVDASNPNRTLILRQVEFKRKYLEHIVQVLVQTINYLSSSIAASSFIANSSPARNSNSPSSSKASSSSSSPDYIADDNANKSPVAEANTSEKQSSNN